jgi:hypothetical protein
VSRVCEARRACVKERGRRVLSTLGEEGLEAALAVGRVACPDCGRPLPRRARGADAPRRAAASPTACVLQALRGYTRAVAGLLRAAPARWRGGDRRRAASQGAGSGAADVRRACVDPADHHLVGSAVESPTRQSSHPTRPTHHPPRALLPASCLDESFGPWTGMIFAVLRCTT